MTLTSPTTVPVVTTVLLTTVTLPAKTPSTATPLTETPCAPTPDPLIVDSVTATTPPSDTPLSVVEEVVQGEESVTVCALAAVKKPPPVRSATRIPTASVSDASSDTAGE